MSIDRVAISNFALAKLGHEEFIVSPTENSRAARFIDKIYSLTRDSMLRSHLWRFARKRWTLAPLVDQPLFDGGNYFQIPTDCLRVLGTDMNHFQTYGRWEVESNKIVAETDILNIVGLARIENEAEFDSCFVEAFACKIAYDIAMPLTQSAEMKDMMGAELRRAMIMAAHTGATEQDSSKFISEVFIQAHY